MEKINDITAVILAGGKNSRINQEKSLIRFQGDCLIDRQVELLQSIFENIIIATSKESIKEKFPTMQLVEDEYINCGPLSGIHSAMKHSPTKSVFVFACDMPFLDTSIILRQISVFRRSNADILVPRHAEGIEPLHAIYSISNLPYLEECLKTKRYSVRSFYQKSHTEYLDFASQYIRNFFNINTPYDLQKII
jgi:molybdopterin-guanine dinucleotide biosynthesis protein A